MKKILVKYSSFVERKPKLPLVIAILITIITIFGMMQLELNLSWVSLAPKGNESAEAYAEISKEFPTLNPIIVSIEAPNYQTEEKILDDLNTMFADSKYVQSVFATADSDFLLKEGLLLWPAEDLEMLQYISADPSLASLLTLQNQFKSQLSSEVLENFAIGQEKAIYHLTKESPNTEKALTSLLYGDNLIRSKDGKKFLVSIMPSFDMDNFELLVPGIDYIESQLKALEITYPGTIVGLTGIHVIGRDEMKSVESDSLFTTILSLLLIILLLIVTFRMFTAPIIASIPLIFGIIWDIGIAGFVIGRLNLMTAFVAVMLIGLGIDFSIHFLAGVTEKINIGKTPIESIVSNIYEIGPSIAIGGMTTAVAFLTLAISSLDLLHELGLVMGIGILVTILALFLILPSLLILMKLKPERINKVKTNYRWIGSFATTAKKFAILTVVTILIGTGIMGYFATQNTFDLNLMNLEPKGLESIKTLDNIIENFGMSADVFQLQVKDLNDLATLTKEFQQVEGVGIVQSINDILPTQNIQLEHINTLRNLQHSSEGTILTSNIETLFFDDIGKNAIISAEIQKDFSKSIINMLDNTKNLKPVSPQGLPTNIKSQFVGTKSYLLSVYPNFNIWTDLGKAKGIKFIEDIKNVNPKITGTPLFMRSLYDSAKSEVVLFGLLVLGTIFLLITLHFKSLKWSSIAMIPLVITIIWTMGIMKLVGLQWNLLNVLALPLIIGIGVDDSVHILHRYIENKESIATTFGTVGRAILSTSLTTMIGFGLLVFSSYRGIAYFGAVLFIGVALAFLMTVLIIPLFMKKEA